MLGVKKMEDWMEDWIQKMNSCTKGKATVKNINYDCENERINLCWIDSFYSRLQGIWSNQQQLSSPNPLKAFENAVQEEYFCRGQTITILSHESEEDESKEYSRVIEVRTFIEHNLDLTMIPLTINDQPLAPERIRMLERVDFSIVGTGEMRTRRPFAWVTKHHHLRKLYENEPSGQDVASRIRNELGLHHLRDNKIHLVEVIYSEEVIVQDSFNIHSPTVFDGCPSEIYRSIDNTPDGWGRTVDLTTYEAALPEAVHSPIPFGEGFRLKYLGETQPINTEYSGETFLNNFPE
jgi:hypothetical protein